MTSVVNSGGGLDGSYIEMFYNERFSYQSAQDFWTWYRSLNTQEWLGPFPCSQTAVWVNNDRYTRWFVDTSSIPNFNDEHRTGFYQVVTTPSFGPTDKPTIAPVNRGMVKLVFNPGSEINTEPYISNNEQREADTYFRPNY
jgi:hypothetical protein